MQYVLLLTHKTAGFKSCPTQVGLNTASIGDAHSLCLCVLDVKSRRRGGAGIAKLTSYLIKILSQL
jgi:hypothetical protein